MRITVKMEKSTNHVGGRCWKSIYQWRRHAAPKPFLANLAMSHIRDGGYGLVAEGSLTQSAEVEEQGEQGPSQIPSVPNLKAVYDVLPSNSVLVAHRMSVCLPDDTSFESLEWNKETAKEKQPASAASADRCPEQPRNSLQKAGRMAKSERQSRSLKSEGFLSDPEASLLDQQDLEESSCRFNDVFDSRDSHMEQINTFLKNVQVLLEAARFLESADRKDGKCEHGYASTFPSDQSTNYQRTRKFRNKKFNNNHNRSTHNELEKNRHAAGDRSW
ncbi:Max-interacting protein 1 [Oryzias melastigma]|uniref:Max-interacting protein 1 n=1 Tax=Oryzias melastigma TaxID=30732 RepID=A0A834C1V9_ORYME|nr:Max-interacting protein 1 [Oryzias melastigma]